MVYERQQALVEVWDQRMPHPLPLPRYLDAEHTAPGGTGLTSRDRVGAVA